MHKLPQKNNLKKIKKKKILLLSFPLENMNSFIFKVKAHKVAIIGATIGATAALRIVLFLLKKRKETPKTKEIE